MKTLRSLFWLFIVVAGLYVGWRVAPVYFANYQLEEAMEDTARDASVNTRRSEEEIRDKVLRQARELDIPLKSEDVKVRRTESSDVLVWGDYTVHVDLPIYPLDLHFQPASKSKKRTM